ncbi:competence/damage-inducible protein A [Streptococcus ovuberis]|uniref:Putative competence-damage inducible protein n=1 Tax=Streptococcus ovuberis TaxID=1936207 RepID=A0A7X6N026_9STRE|nr:competence/damage-inducible protein A [Streptococcus ovuberis]NKZ20963.1 competence/damage-inducible protein A [Streptococcus ovuberis]
MKAELIAVGTEILTGQIVNTNAQFLSEKFAQIGMDVFYHIAVGDNEERLLKVLKTASKRSDLIVLCGGLGPTEDDLTKQTLAKFLGRPLIFDPDAMDKLDRFFASRPDYVRTSNNDRQAQIIDGSQPLPNVTGLAVGGYLDVDGVTYIVLPGPPSELKPMVNQELIPLLDTTGQKLYSRVLRFFGIGESQLVTLLSDLIAKQSDPTIAPYAKTGEVTLRLSTKARDPQKADEKLTKLEEEILNHGQLRNLMYGYGDDNSLAKLVFDLLSARQETISAAESLTAGLFQATIADFPGASAVLEGGFVTYSPQQKAQLLQLDKEQLARQGVVSASTACDMAEQARAIVGSDYGIALTGVAGPEHLEGHPAGTVFIGLATREFSKAYPVNIGGRSRQDIRHIACLHAFNLMRQTLLNDGNLV